MPSSNALSPVTVRALADLKSLALLPEKEGALSAARQEINRITEQLNLLDDMRYSAHGIIELYTQVPALEAVNITVSYRFNEDYGRPYREYSLQLSDTKLREGTIESDASLEQFEEDLKQAVMGGNVDPDKPGLRDFEGGITLFTDDLPCLFAAADRYEDDRQNVDLSVVTSREVIMEAIDEGGVDAVAAALFPERWARLSESLGLPAYSSANAFAPARPRP